MIKKYKVIMVLVISILISSGIFGTVVLKAMAKESDQQTVYQYYKSIKIEKGDTLWSIAEEYKNSTSMDTVLYVEELKRMNGLTKDEIQAGKYLTIMYFSDELKE